MIPVDGQLVSAGSKKLEEYQLFNKLKYDWLFLLEGRCVTDVTIKNLLLTYHVKQQIDPPLLWVCTVVDHRRHQNVVSTSVTHSAVSYGPHFLFLPYFV